MKGIIGKKVGMIQWFDEDGFAVAATVIKAGPCFVVMKKVLEKDGYEALQLGFEPLKASKATKPMIGHFAKAGLKPMRYLAEFRGMTGYEVGQEIDVGIFKKGELVDVTGFSKGRGFAGVVKRWGFRGGRATRGSMFHRAPGSIGSSTFPARVVKGKRMPGHYGNERVTIRNLEVLDVEPEKDLLIVKGAVPGPRGGILYIKCRGG
jgi:large subunit ribosomal protein L3